MNKLLLLFAISCCIAHAEEFSYMGDLTYTAVIKGSLQDATSGKVALAISFNDTAGYLRLCEQPSGWPGYNVVYRSIFACKPISDLSSSVKCSDSQGLTVMRVDESQGGGYLATVAFSTGNEVSYSYTQTLQMTPSFMYYGTSVVTKNHWGAATSMSTGYLHLASLSSFPGGCK